MTGKELFLLLENKIIFESKEYKKDCEFVNLKTGERINCKYAISQVETELEYVELIKKNEGIAKDLNKLEKIKAIVYKTNDEINETTDTVLINYFVSMAFNEIIEVLDNDRR